MAKIIVTGGAGFIGSHVVDAYVAAGHEVAIVDNLLTGSKKNLNPAAAFYEVDIRNPDLAAVFEKEQPDFVTHLAAQIDVRLSVEKPLFDAEINILGSINLLELCIKHQVKKFLFASTGGAIYGQPENLPADETCPSNPECHYATSKLAFEGYIKLYQRLYDLPYAILRFPNVFGPRQNPEGEAGVCSILIGLMLQGKTPVLYGHGNPLRDYVYVGDIARGCLLALDQGLNTTLNLGSGKGTTVRELFDTLAELTGFSGAPRLEALRPGEVEKVYITGAKALKELGWKPEVTLKEGLAKTVAHIRAERGEG